MKKLKGFTLIELLITMAVLAIMVSIAVPSFNGVQDSGKRTKARSDIKLLQTAVEAYYSYYRVYPTDLSSVEAHGLVVKKLPSDPWKGEGSTYQYAMTDVGYPDGSIKWHYAIWTTGNKEYSNLVNERGASSLPSTTIGTTNLPKTHPIYDSIFVGEWF